MGILGSVFRHCHVLLVIAVLFSNNRKAINLRTVLGALAIQIGFAALILYKAVWSRCITSDSKWCIKCYSLW